MKKLKSCSECGSDKVQLVNEDGFFIDCLKCNTFVFASTELGVVRKWNRKGKK